MVAMCQGKNKQHIIVQRIKLANVKYLGIALLEDDMQTQKFKRTVDPVGERLLVTSRYS